MENLISELLPAGEQLLNVNTTILVFILAIVPGFIIVFVRSQLVTGRILPYPAGFLAYLSVSTVYWALLFFLLMPIVEVLVDLLIKCGLWWSKPVPNTVKGLLVLVLMPILTGVVAGWVSNKTFVYLILSKLRLNPVHPTPNAWEWIFSDFDEQFVLVKLNNDTQFGGLMGTDSFVSSDPNERDIYIQEIYEIDDKNEWNAKGHGVFVSSGEISTIEFIPLATNEEG